MSLAPTEPPPPTAGSTGLRGHLHLTCGLDSRGQSALLRQSFRAPFHISKPHTDADTLVVNVVNPTAGLLAGDRTECHVQVEPGASLLLTSPGANRAHRMRGGAEAYAVQSFSVAAGGWLEYLPELFIPQADTRYRQHTQLRADPAGELFYVESLAPGRTACGEVFAYHALTFSTQSYVGSQLVGLERYSLVRDSANLASLRARFTTPYYASCYFLSTRLKGDEEVWQKLLSIQGPDLWLGVSRLAGAGFILKALAASSLRLRAALHAVRTELYHACGRRVPDMRRTIPIG